MSEINRMSMTQVMAYYYELRKQDNLERAQMIENIRVGGNANAETYSSIIRALRKTQDE